METKALVLRKSHFSYFKRLFIIYTTIENAISIMSRVKKIKKTKK